jgi:hypothetical protein
MKRQLITAAMIGTSALAFAQGASARECVQTPPGNPLVCREIAHAALGPNFCLVPEGFNIRAVTSSGTNPDPWKTLKPIALETVPTQASPSSAPCNRRINFSNSKLEISRDGSGYHLNITGAQQVQMDLTVAQDHGKDLWLTGAPTAQPNMHYFVFMRDHPGSADLPKFLYVEALDDNDGRCKENAPVLAKTVIAGQCHGSAQPAKGGGLPFEKETGVGGGGEHP